MMMSRNAVNKNGLGAPYTSNQQPYNKAQWSSNFNNAKTINSSTKAGSISRTSQGALPQLTASFSASR